MSAPATFSSVCQPALRGPRAGVDELDHAGVVDVDVELGLLAVAEATGPPGAAEAGARLALHRLMSQLRRNGDIISRCARHPTADLRSRLQAVLRQGFSQAHGELLALGTRRQAAVVTSMDAVLVLPGEAVVAHVGAGEVYLLHEGLAHRLSGNAEPGLRPPSRRGGGAQAPHQVVSLPATPLGASALEPKPQALTVTLAEGDRLVVLGASLAPAISLAALREAATRDNLDLVSKALANGVAIDDHLPRVLGMCRVGSMRIGTQDRLDLLRRVEIFQWCSDDELVAFAGLTRPRRFRAGELLLRQGSLNSTLYLLVTGQVGVNRDGQRVAVTGQGSVFGEMSMLDQPRASATVEAITAVEVLTIPRAAFLQALKGDANMAVKVLWSLLLRVSANLRATTQRLAVVTAAADFGAPDFGAPDDVAPDDVAPDDVAPHEVAPDAGPVADPAAEPSVDPAAEPSKTSTGADG